MVRLMSCGSRRGALQNEVGAGVGLMAGLQNELRAPIAKRLPHALQNETAGVHRGSRQANCRTFYKTN